MYYYILLLMTFKYYFEHTESIFVEFKILKITKTNYYLTSLFMFWYHLPEIFINYFVATE